MSIKKHHSLVLENFNFRDLKPENCVLEQKGHLHIKIIDFGTSILASPKETLTDMIGTVSILRLKVSALLCGS